jgi:hypothetical protein
MPIVSTTPSSSQVVELGDEPAQLRRLADATEALFQRAQEEKEKDTEALQKEKAEVLVKLRATQDSVVSHEIDKAEL